MLGVWGKRSRENDYVRENFLLDNPQKLPKISESEKVLFTYPIETQRCVNLKWTAKNVK